METQFDWTSFGEDMFLVYMGEWLPQGLAHMDGPTASQFRENPEMLELCRDRWRRAMTFSQAMASKRDVEDPEWSESQVRFIAWAHAMGRVMGYIEGAQASNLEHRNPN